MNPHFWLNKTTWPDDGLEFVFLGRAVEKIGRLKFGYEWSAAPPLSLGGSLIPRVAASSRLPLERPNIRFDDGGDHEDWDGTDDDIYDPIDAEFEHWANQFRQIASEIKGACLAQIVISGVRDMKGGSVIPLDAHAWNTEEEVYLLRFDSCQIDSKAPFHVRDRNPPSAPMWHFARSFRRSNIKKRPHWIYLEQKSLSKFLGTILPATRDSLEKSEKACEGWLVELMTANETTSTSKDDYESMACAKFNVEGRAFMRCWDKAKKRTGSKWGKPGPKRSK